MIFEELFPELNDPHLNALIVYHSDKKEFPAGTVILEPGQKIKFVPLLLNGSIRIDREDNEGREVFLYFLSEGDTCSNSLTCGLNAELSDIRVTAETDCELLLIPQRFINTWMQEFECWKNFVMNAYRKRYAELLSTIDSIAFQKMDDRLMQYLTEKSIVHNSNELKGTHQEIADALHSTREVISRLLKQLEKQGKVLLQRNCVTVL